MVAITKGSALMATTKDWKKIVVRHLPPSFSESTFIKEIEPRFSGLFNLVAFFPGKSSVKRRTFSRAYIDFKSQEDVVEFSEGFNGHSFVNEKGTHHKALVEYAPHQRVPKMLAKKDKLEGSILQDPEYLKFVEMLAKPVEYLPSAEVQLERREAQRSLNSGEQSVIITPLMEFVRKKRASKHLSQRKNAQGGGSSLSTSSKIILKRNFDNSKDSLCAGSKQKFKPNQQQRLERDKSKPQLDKSKKGCHKSQTASVTSNGNVQRNVHDLATRKKSDLKSKHYTQHTWTQNGRKQTGDQRQITGSRQFYSTYLDSTKPEKQLGGFFTTHKKVWVAKPGPG